MNAENNLRVDNREECLLLKVQDDQGTVKGPRGHESVGWPQLQAQVQ